MVEHGQLGEGGGGLLAGVVGLRGAPWRGGLRGAPWRGGLARPGRALARAVWSARDARTGAVWSRLVEKAEYMSGFSTTLVEGAAWRAIPRAPR